MTRPAPLNGPVTVIYTHVLRNLFSSIPDINTFRSLRRRYILELLNLSWRGRKISTACLYAADADVDVSVKTTLRQSVRTILHGIAYGQMQSHILFASNAQSMQYQKLVGSPRAPDVYRTCKPRLQGSVAKLPALGGDKPISVTIATGLEHADFWHYTNTTEKDYHLPH